VRLWQVNKNWGTWIVRAETADEARRFVWDEEAEEYGYEPNFCTPGAEGADVELLSTEGPLEILGSFS
jgi:hypothetical protein